MKVYKMTYHNLDNLLWFHPVYWKTVDLHDPVPRMEQTYTHTHRHS